jgi:hypothetical protein
VELGKGFYTCPNSSLIVEIFKIRYRSRDYVKAWVRYYNHNMTFLSETRTQKLYKNKITHWEKITC